ncbi:hypothetical protein HUT19_20500 [Streptomyces sp. NA02950]|uniref:hypothetical protein n=1 Tax=Streptomyces sp. NA02950 TaxID=2742137 RepID=UPI00159167C2|nr:hypothetical protein [Streptomyces sp. NA02950]QKV93846.1 hypothetical protein HUT19_20500 [Streptomyces sp. NA02950]
MTRNRPRFCGPGRFGYLRDCRGRDAPAYRKTIAVAAVLTAVALATGDHATAAALTAVAASLLCAGGSWTMPSTASPPEPSA